jgi:hypothetical protein
MFGVTDETLGQAVALVGRAESVRPKTFTQTPDGDWRTIVAGPDGTKREYVYVPGTKVRPRVETVLDLTTGPTGPVVSYRYTIWNEAGARQQLARFFLGAVQRVDVRSVPREWEYQGPQSPGAAIFVGRHEGDVPRGIPPGQALEGLVVEAPILPGVVTARTMGNVPLTTPVPPGFSDAQADDLLRLSRPGFVDVRVIGPAIPAGVSEPELGLDVLLARVSLHYSNEMRKAGHPDAQLVATLLSGIAKTGATLADPDVRSALDRLRALRTDRLTDPWHRQLSSALGICVEALLSGSLPVRG